MLFCRSSKSLCSGNFSDILKVSSLQDQNLDIRHFRMYARSRCHDVTQLIHLDGIRRCSCSIIPVNILGTEFHA